MFKFLKEKLSGWTKKISEEAEPVKTEKIDSKEEIEEVPIPKKFNEGMQNFQPDLEKLKKIGEELEKKGTNIEAQPGTKSFFKKITSKITKVEITEKEFDVYAEDLKLLLLENNVAFEVAERIISELKEKILGKELLKKEIEPEIREALKEIIESILITPFPIIERIKEKNADQSKDPYVILFCGVNGTGKTTTIAKIASYLKNKNISCVIAAADTFRAASIEQLKHHGEKIGIKVISQQYGADPAAVGFDAVSYAKKNFINCVLIDTAGRMHTAKNLLKEMEKIVRVCKPDLKLFVGESITGNDSIEQVRSFDWAIGIDGIILTKADVDEKGGTALSLGYVTKKPILFLGTGQEYKKIEVFDKNKFIRELGL